MGARYSHLTWARLALSAAAKGVSDQARGLVSADDRGSGAGEIIERAVQLVDDARAVRARAVVYERGSRVRRGRPSAAIGISRQTAHERFAEVERRWKDPLRGPDGEAQPGGRRAAGLPAGAEDPERWESSWTGG